MPSVKPYKLMSREFKLERTAISIGRVGIGRLHLSIALYLQ